MVHPLTAPTLGSTAHPPRRPLHRRRLLGAAAGAGAWMLTGSGAGGAVAQSTALPPGSPATPPGPVPGFDDPGRWAGRTVVVGGWGGEVQTALREMVWQPFATATGCTLRETATDYSRLATAAAAGQFFADLLLVDPVWADDALDRGLITAVDPAVVDPEIASPFPGGEGTVPAFAYALVAAFRRDAITAEAPPANWMEWWNAERFPGQRALARDPFGTFEFALLADGVPADALYPLDTERAVQSLKAISGAILDRWWDSGAQPVAWLGTERAEYASAWHHRVVAAQWDGYAVDLVWDQGLLVVDRWAVPVNAAAPDVAADLLRYAQAPPVQAALAAAVPLGPVHPAAFELLDPLVLATLPTAPSTFPQLLPVDAAWWAANRGEAVERMNRWLLGTLGA